jgi:transketolase N-terminal domain/subunit
MTTRKATETAGGKPVETGVDALRTDRHVPPHAHPRDSSSRHTSARPKGIRRIMNAVTTSADHNQLANAIRALSMDAVQRANSGHPGAPMGMADMATVLFTRHLKFDAGNPDWPDRDRFILSNGHASMLLYSLLYLSGSPDMTIDELKNFRQLGSRTPGHPEYGHAAGVETTTGPLGQGIANAVGFALAERMMNARYGNDLVDHHTYVFAGDGCLMEGISHEASCSMTMIFRSTAAPIFQYPMTSLPGSPRATGTSPASTATTPKPSTRPSRMQKPATSRL